MKLVGRTLTATSATVCAAALVSAVAAVVGPAPFASANAVPPDCNRPAHPGKLYIYWDANCNTNPIGVARQGDEDKNYGDGRGDFQYTDNNRATSIINNTSVAVSFYARRDFNQQGTDGEWGYWFCLPAKRIIWDLGESNSKKWSNGKNANNQISSHIFRNVATC